MREKVYGEQRPGNADEMKSHLTPTCLSLWVLFLQLFLKSLFCVSWFLVMICRSWITHLEQVTPFLSPLLLTVFLIQSHNKLLLYSSCRPSSRFSFCCLLTLVRFCFLNNDEVSTQDSTGEQENEGLTQGRNWAQVKTRQRYFLVGQGVRRVKERREEKELNQDKELNHQEREIEEGEEYLEEREGKRGGRRPEIQDAIEILHTLLSLNQMLLPLWLFLLDTNGLYSLAFYVFILSHTFYLRERESLEREREIMKS